MLTTSIDPRQFRDVMGHLPTGVCALTARDLSGAPVAMIVGSLVSVSLEPALIGFFPQRTSGSWAQLQQAKTFCVNILAHDQQDLCRQLTRKTGERFGDVAWTPSPKGNPILTGAVAWLECTFFACGDAGDHLYVLAEVCDMKVVRPESSLVFHMGAFRHLV